MQNLIICNLTNGFIVFYVVILIGTLSHAKVILELLLPPLTIIKNGGEELIRKGKEYFLN